MAFSDDFWPYVDQQVGIGAGGYYQATLVTGATSGIASGGPMVSFRWGDAGPTTTPSNIARPRQCILMNVDIGAVVTTAFTAGQSVDAECIIARGWTASDSGGTQITAANVSRARANMPPSLITDLRVCTTAALTAGTRTLDGSGFAIATIYTQNSAGGGDTQQSVYACEAHGLHPIVFTQNEGFIIRISTAQGAAGVVKYFFAIQWAEVPFFPTQ